MKKILTILAIMFTLGVTNVQAEELPNVSDGEKVTIYMFRGTGCSACAAAVEEFNSYVGKYDDYFELVTFDIWGETPDQDNGTLLDYFVQTLNGESTIPFFIVGDNFSQNGFSQEVIDAALSEFTNPDYNDIVAEKIKGQEHLYTMTNLEEACESEGIEYIGPGEEAKASYDTIIVVGIFVLVIAGIGFLVFAPQKKAKK